MEMNYLYLIIPVVIFFLFGKRINRNKIRTFQGSNYLTIPVNRNYMLSKIVDVPLPKDKKWRRSHWIQIYRNYVKTPFFKDHEKFFENVYQEDFEYLWQLNNKILLYLLKCFQINVELHRTSELNACFGLYKTDLMIEYLKTLGADLYFSGPSGKSYLEVKKFQDNGIDLKFAQFDHPVYQQRYPGFEPRMSAIDLLFNHGPKSGEIIRSSISIEK